MQTMKEKKVKISPEYQMLGNRLIKTESTIWGHDNSYTRHLVQKPKPDISYKSETKHFVQKQNRTFRTKMKPDISCNLYYTTYYNVVSYVHIPLVP